MAVKFKQGRVLGALSLTPLIDVVFLLLIFFLVPFGIVLKISIAPVDGGGYSAYFRKEDLEIGYCNHRKNLKADSTGRKGRQENYTKNWNAIAWPGGAIQPVLLLYFDLFNVLFS